MHAASPINRLPVDPIARRLPDGRILRVIPFNRHLIPMPPLIYPEWSFKSDPKLWVYNWGHPEIALLADRIEYLLDPARIDGGDAFALSEVEILRLRSLEAVLPVVIEPVRKAIAARWSADFMLPCFGNWPTHGEVLRGFKERGGRGEVYHAIGFFHSAAMVVELIEARGPAVEDRGAADA